MMWGCIGEMAVGEFLDPFDAVSIVVQLIDGYPHGWVRDSWDRDEWGRLIPGAGIRYT